MISRNIPKTIFLMRIFIESVTYVTLNNFRFLQDQFINILSFVDF
jgi:hypothetical protein